MDAYYLLKVNKFNDFNGKYTSYQQVGIHGHTDDKPSVSFEKEDMLTINDDKYSKYKLTTEKTIRQRGRTYTTCEIFESFIAINDNCFYYYLEKDILILHCSKDSFLQFVRTFKTNSDFIFEKFEIDFEYIITNQKSIGIQGIWLGRFDDTNLDSLLLLGNSVENSDKYRQAKDEGAEISNITIIYDHNGIDKKIMITKDGGIILYNNEDEITALNLIKEIYKNLFNKNELTLV